MRCIIHIGMHKTGSTSIQNSLRGFSDDRFLYARLGADPNHSLAMYSFFAESPERHHQHKAGGRDRSAVQDYGAKVRIDLERSISAAHGRTLLVSGEDISVLPQNDLDKLRRYFREHFDELLICGYVRPPAGYISSEFQQRIKGGLSVRVSPDQEYRSYEKTFRKFDEIFGRENVQLWKFEPKSFPGGCVVQDFCARLDISFPVERVISENKSLSRQAASLLYAYCKFSKRLGFRSMLGAESQRLVAMLGDIQHDKFRFSPAIVRPVLEANRADIQWMEERLGQSLHEELGEYRPGDVRDEADLLKPDPEVVRKLLALLGDAAPAGITGETPEDVALLVHAIRQNNRQEMGPKPRAGTAKQSLLNGLVVNRIHFFVHIPKTAGTSFREALERNELAHVLHDYGKGDPNSDADLMAIDYKELTPEHGIFRPEKYNFICGHVSYRKYAHCVTPDSVVSIVRNPIERLVSEFQHSKRHDGFTGGFTDFYTNPAYDSFVQDKQSKMLKGLELSPGPMIGLTSHYKYFVELYSSKLGLPMELVAVNTAPVSDKEERLHISPAEIKSAYRWNKIDIDFFFEKGRIFAGLIQVFGYNTVPPVEAEWNCRIDESRRVVGWLSCGYKDCYFIVISVNGDRRVVIALDQNRSDIYEKGLSENPTCGFAYPLSLLGVEKGDKLSVEVLNAPGFKKTLTAP